RPLVALDWGTSTLRAARLDAQGQVLEERSLPRGILTVPAGEFPAVFAQAIAQWPVQADTLYLLSGMVGSRQGWREAPYCACPAGFADIAAALAWVEPGKIAIVPGLSCEAHGVPDVMRGEETQIFGALQLLGLEQGLFVLPGTHSKWVRVANSRIAGFSTFMTGEFYALLRQHSILARTLPQDDVELDAQAFERGLRHAQQSGNLMHSAFSVRALALFDRLPAQAMPSYLSGLVIGEELRSQHLHRLSDAVVVIGAPALVMRYELALRLLDIPVRTVGAEASWRGLWAIARSVPA
ncbi:MAG: 2-keto-3-deoxygalactonate kinase, partial [Ramlibacter sp.]|nr:2-keto-3-deoxygalactonate kinase [Ramlibacter sp.]